MIVLRHLPKLRSQQLSYTSTIILALKAVQLDSIQYMFVKHVQYVECQKLIIDLKNKYELAVHYSVQII